MTRKLFNFSKNAYLAIILIILGVFAFITSVIVAYPAISYLAAKFF